MKKVFVFIIFIMLLFISGCNFSKDDVNDITNNLFTNYGELKNGTVIEGSYDQFKNINIDSSYLGYGYDIINDEYIKKDYINISAPILDMDKIGNAKLKMVKENNAETIEIDSESMEDFVSKYNVSMKVYGKTGKCFSGGLAFDYNGSQHSKTYSHFYKNILNVKTFNLYLTNSLDELKNLLSDEFKNDLLNLHPEALFDKYGTHMLKEVSMGGRIEVSSQYTSNTSGSTDEVKSAVNTHMKALKAASLNTEALASIENTLNKYNIEYYYNVKQIGGALTNINSVSTLDNKYSEWLSSFDNDLNYSALSGIVGENSLVALWDLLPNSNVERREELYLEFKRLSGAAFDELCSNFKINTNRTLNVSVDGPGKVNDYKYQHFDGEEVTLLAVADSDSRFIGWYNGEELVSNSTMFTFNIHVNTNLVAKFGKLNDDSCLLVVHSNGYGEVTGNEQQIYSYGDEIILNANPSYANEFEGWYIDNVCVSNNLFYSFKITKDTTIIAKFTNNNIEKCLLVVNKMGTGDGQLYYENEYYMRSVATVKAIPNKDSIFAGWYIDDKLVSTNAEYSFVITDSMNIFAKFDENLVEEFVINTCIMPENGGTIVGTDGSFEKDQLVTLKAIPSEGYVFKEWNIMNQTYTSNPYSFYIDKNVQVTAVFEEITVDVFTINYILNNEKFGIPVQLINESTKVLENSVPKFEVPSSSYLIFKGWFIDEKIKISDENGVVLHNVKGYTDAYGRWLNEDCNLYASWELDKNYKYIGSASDLKNISKDVSGKYVLTSSIDMNGEEWNPVVVFKGFIDGNNYAIYNFTITRISVPLPFGLSIENVGSATIGFIGINEGIVQNLIIGTDSCTNYDNTYSVKYCISSTENDAKSILNVGGIAGKNNGEIINCKLNNVFINGLINDVNNNEDLEISVGGITGVNNNSIKDSIVINSYIDADAHYVTEDNGDDNYGWAGGICGKNFGVISNVAVEKTCIDLDVRGNGCKGNKSFPYASLGEIIGEQYSGTLSGISRYSNIRKLYISEGTYTKPTKHEGDVVGLVSGGTVNI